MEVQETLYLLLRDYCKSSFDPRIAAVAQGGRIHRHNHVWINRSIAIIFPVRSPDSCRRQVPAVSVSGRASRSKRLDCDSCHFSSRRDSMGLG